ncbi:MAG: HIT family protein [Candidatus Magasanikbacteria bacterium]
MNCIFCKIIDGEIDSKKIYEDEYVIAILDANPVAPGHSMVIPKHHTRDIMGMPEDHMKPFFSAVQEVVGMLEDSFDLDGFTMGINHKVGQAVDHLHYHIIPRWEDDGGTSLHGVVQNSPDVSNEELAQKIKKSS